MPPVIALIMAGGGGKRLWPASRVDRPKQLMPDPLEPWRSLLAATASRLMGFVDMGAIHVVTVQDQLEAVREALPQLPPRNFVAEPQARNTGPAIALSLIQIRAQLGEKADDAIIIALPADHMISDEPRFRACLRQAVAHARHSNRVVTLGIEPEYAATGYGYMQRGDGALDPVEEGVAELPTFEALRFVEKPDQITAASYLASGDYLWNAGIFVFPLKRLLEDFDRYCPDMVRALAPVAQTLGAGGDATALTQRAYSDIRSVPLDIAIMEKLDDLLVVPAKVGWSDLGGWKSIADLLPTDADGNAIAVNANHEVVVIDSKDNLIFSEDATVGIIGVEDLAIVVSGGKVLVCPKYRTQEVRQLVKELKRRQAMVQDQDS
jgi:mannose-1-phosphate guanylyltransferase